MLETNTSNNKIGIAGYDPVSYFEIMQYTPSLGKKEFSSVDQGVIYYFRNQKNKTVFDKNPDQYLPQYGGYCATAVSEGATAPIDPHTFLIQDDKLYLFYNDIFGSNTLRDWNTNPTNRLHSADRLRKENKVTNTGGGIVYSSLWKQIKSIFKL